MYLIQINSFDDWRREARELLKRAVSPEHVYWQASEQNGLPFGGESDHLSLPVKQPELNIPRDFFSLAKSAACFRDEARWPLLYSVAWRLLYEDKKLLNNKLDRQVASLQDMSRSVARDIHKMEAFVRFRQVNRALYHEASNHNHNHNHNQAIPEEQAPLEYYVAWFEPLHLIVPTASAFFVKRFNNMYWSILTPDLCAHWDCKELRFSPGQSSSPRIDDELEKLWLQYYESIFNPARLKLKAMQAEMPKKYWHNLPEARLIPELTRNAKKRMEGMIEESQTGEWQKTAKSRFVKKKQQDLRASRLRGPVK